MREAQERQPVVVEPGEGQPVVLGGTVVTLRLGGAATGDSYAAMNIRLAPGAGAALHRHLREDESFAVLDGAISFQLGATTRVVAAGGLVFIPRGLAHAFRNDGAEHAEALIVVTPSGLERYFAELGALLGSSEPPTDETLAALNERYGLQFIARQTAIRRKSVAQSVSMETQQALESLGLAHIGQIFWNCSMPALVEEAVRRGEAQLASNGGLVAYTGERTGRSPKDRFVVHSPATADVVDWGTINQPVSEAVYEALRERVIDYLQERDLFVLDARAGADPASTLPLRVITQYAWHNLFAKQLFLQLTPDELAAHVPEWTILSVPGFKTDPQRDGVNSDIAVMLNFERREVLICGTEYAGESKKSIFSVLNFLLPQRGILPMHCSANQGARGDVALFFGLSGTGKTSLSSDPERRLIGDDEHGWNENGVFNFEGGCYAKCIRLSAANEPQIYAAIRFGAVIENVVIDPVTHVPDYNDERYTENTRVAYPLEHIDNIVASKRGGHASVLFFLTADAFGVLPPIARLTPEQAMYHFLSGYTAKLAGTEVGVTDPQATFEACFGAPFLPLPATVYARMLRDKLNQHGARVYLLNTGWSGGPFGVGKRMSIAHTRTMLRAAIAGELEHTETYTDPLFGLHVPTHIEGVPDAVMRPRDTWDDPAEYDRLARVLAERFVANFNAKFAAQAPELAAQGPRL